MYRRSGGGSRKEQQQPKPTSEDGGGGRLAELLVFGYASKVFRDDERALYHEHGKHLIPWMGDKNIMIDRYDGRGHLHDLSEFDADSWNRDYQLSEEETRIEALCDEERYLALHTDLLEEEARQEEEYKRLSEALADEGSYNAVAFRYSADYYDPSQPTEEEEEAGKETEEPEPQDGEEPFIAPPGLIIPSDVELPATVKMHAIIERTANFVCKQGAQFEIVLKAKQSRNSQFDFLRFDHYLNPYYKHILRAMKEGRYTTASGSKQDEAPAAAHSDQSDDDDDDDDDGDGSYLHPSLFASRKSSRLQELMKPLQVMDPDHPLAALVRKVQQDQNGVVSETPKAENTEPGSTATEYHTDPSMAAVYYGYCLLPDGSYCLAPPPPGIDASTYYNSLPAGTLPTASSSVPPPPGTTPPPNPDPSPVAHTATSGHTSAPPPVVIAETSSQAAVSAPAIIPPPPDIQPVIDKLAEYVARNGVKFEASVRAKNDPRFDFLQSWHQYNTYYEFKKHYFMQKEGIVQTEVLPGSDSRGPLEAAGATTDSQGGSKGVNCSSREGKLIKASFAPISFAIKVKENDLLPLEKNRVRLDDDSDEEQDKEAGLEGSAVGGASVVVREAPPAPLVEEKRPTLSLEELEAKQAKQKLEARLAAAAREKLAQASKESKEKQLQAERKRKAALFLQTLRGPLALDEPPLQPEPELPHSPPPPSPPDVSRVPAFGGLPRPVEMSPGVSRDPALSLVPPSPPPSGSSLSQRSQDRERRKKKHKKRSRSKSRSRSPSRSKNKHGLPSAYRTVRKSRSRSRTPGRRERRRDDRQRDTYAPPVYRHSNSPGFSKKRSRSRSPHEKRKRSRSQLKARASSCSPSSSPGPTSDRKRPTARSISPVSSQGSPAFRDDSQERQKQVASAIVSSVQTKITQDLMAKVRAMLAASKDIQTSTS